VEDNSIDPNESKALRQEALVPNDAIEANVAIYADKAELSNNKSRTEEIES